MSTHRIEPERATLHGHFSRDLPPVLTIESGDTVRYRTLDARLGNSRGAYRLEWSGAGSSRAPSNWIAATRCAGRWS